MATYGGTQQKCKACEKTVYLVDQLRADDRVYHRACFRCYHCKGTLKLGNYSSFEGVLYCRPHFGQLLKMAGSLDKFESAASPPGAPRILKTAKSLDQDLGYKRISNMFAGTQDKCTACKKTVYPIEKVAVEGNSYHRPCFRCFHGGCIISPSNYIAHDQRLYCKHHHTQLFKVKGNFSQFSRNVNLTATNGKIDIPV